MRTSGRRFPTKAEAYDFHSYAPRYLASNVLILGENPFLQNGEKDTLQVRSGALDDAESSAGVYGIDQNTMKIWYEGKTCTLPEKELEKLRLCLIEKIKK